MNIVLKNSFKNIFKKPLRTLLVVFAIFMCCLSALLSFDLGSMLGRIMSDFYGRVSRADFMVRSDGRDISDITEGLPELDQLSIIANGEKLYKDIDGEYNYVKTDVLSIYGLDINEAVSMEFMQEMEMQDNMIYISNDFSEDFGYSEGDTIVLHDRSLEEVELTVGGILPKESNNPILSGYYSVVNLTTSDILSCGDRNPSIVMIDIRDDSKIEEAKDAINNKYPGIAVVELKLSDSLQSMIDEITIVFYLLFAATVLLVIFVTSSICNRIVSERMSYIGVLRSLGMSIARTTRILLLENVLYALLGSIPAVLIYCALRAIAAAALKSSELGQMGFILPDLSKSLLIGVILGAVLIECLIPLKAILSALKTSIRDIIFDNRDTEYKFGKVSLAVGLICLVSAVILAVFSKDLVAAIFCLVLSIVALSVLFPRILRAVANTIRKVADKKDHAAWSLAAAETISRKSTVGSGVLCSTAASMCIIVVTLAYAMFGITSDIEYSSDVVAGCNTSMNYYSYVGYLDGVTDVEPIYYQSTQYALKDEENINLGYIYALPEDGFRYYSRFENLPAGLSDDSILIDSNYASKYGIKEGDSITVIYNPESLAAIEREYTVAGVMEELTVTGMETIFISDKEYVDLFLNKPAELLVKCDDPKSTAEAMQTYGKATYSTVKTLSDIAEEREVSNFAVNAVINSIIVIAIAMTIIGVISNLLIGFEGRKKECAVMLSTAMSKKTLSGIFFKEVLITSLTASSVGVIVGTVLLIIINRAMGNMELMNLDMDVDIGKSILFFFILTIAFTITILFPIHNLKKMKISEQIKYE